MKVVSNCKVCQIQFEQETRRARPYKFCETCRKLLWYEKKKAIALRAAQEGNK